MQTIKVKRTQAEGALQIIRDAGGAVLGANVSGDTITLHVMMPDDGSPAGKRAGKGCECDICRENASDLCK